MSWFILAKNKHLESFDIYNQVNIERQACKTHELVSGRKQEGFDLYNFS